MTRFCIGCKNDWCLSADGTSHDTGSSIVGCTAWPHDEVAECPCDGRACDDLPGGPLPGCPYRVATKGLTHFVPRIEESADAATQAPKASVLEDRDGEASARTAETEEACRHCASEVEDLRKQAFALKPSDQFRLAFFVAENLGYDLKKSAAPSDAVTGKHGKDGAA